jgi:6-phosphogluconate dehydrogenase
MPNSPSGGIRVLDTGTSGGVWGARHGACFMAGGDPEAYALVAPLLIDLAYDEHAVQFGGAPGTGHFVKLVHNAIEFGMVQAIAEGVELLERSGFSLDLPAVFDNWNHGSVIGSWLVELMRALEEHPDLDRLSSYVEDTGEVKWVLEWALRRDIPSPVIYDSQQTSSWRGHSGAPWSGAAGVLRARECPCSRCAPSTFRAVRRSPPSAWARGTSPRAAIRGRSRSRRCAPASISA